MGNHKKAASCTAIPSFTSFTPLSDKNTVPNELPTFILTDKLSQVSLHHHHHQHKERPHKSQSFYLSNHNQFPLPSFCIYSRAALSDEYATESDIIQFMSPQSKIMEERLPMFVGVLQSLFVAVNDLQFGPSSDTEDDDEEDDDNNGEEEPEEEEDEDDIDGEEVEERTRRRRRSDITTHIHHNNKEEGEEEDNNDEEEEEDDDSTTIHEERLWLKKDKKSSSPFSIIGLNTMKIISCNLLEENEQDMSKELGLAIMVPAHFSDRTISHYTNMLYHSITKANLISNTCAKDIGEQIAPMIHYWFSQFHGDKILLKKEA